MIGVRCHHLVGAARMDGRIVSIELEKLFSFNVIVLVSVAWLGTKDA
jgi:hypothetical protein